VSAKPTPPTHLPDPGNAREVLAYWIRLLRVEKGWSQERLAHECELDRTYVSAVERCRWNIALANIERIAQALGVEAWTLLKPPEQALKPARKAARKPTAKV
jgi:transcriptional regulator with XRE-family HTH domain